MNNDACREKLEARINEWNTDLDKRKDRAPMTMAAPSLKYEARIAKIREHQAEAQREFIDIQSAHITTWNKLRNGTDEAWYRLKEAVTEAKLQLK